MVQNIMTTIGSKLNDDLDFLFITGDVYDSLITDGDSAEAKVINGFITWVTSRCSLHNITLWVLKGTTSHDARQSEAFVHINNGLVKPCDLMYFDKVGVHFKNGVSFLVVPDNAATTHAGVRAKVEAALKEAGVSKVNVGLTHGLYDSHMMSQYTDECHESEFYLSVVDTLILNGHIHTRSLFKWLATVGSFDRICQGEMEPKGALYGVIDVAAKTFTAHFLENKKANLFNLYTLPDDVLDLNVAYSMVMDNLGELETKGGWLSIAHAKELNIKELISRLNNTYQGYIEFSAKKAKDKKVTVDKIQFAKLVSKPIAPTTLGEMLIDKLGRLDIPVTDVHLEVIAEVL